MSVAESVRCGMNMSMFNEEDCLTIVHQDLHTSLRHHHHFPPGPEKTWGKAAIKLVSYGFGQWVNGDSVVTVHFEKPSTEICSYMYWTSVFIHACSCLSACYYVSENNSACLTLALWLGWPKDKQWINVTRECHPFGIATAIMIWLMLQIRLFLVF